MGRLARRAVQKLSPTERLDLGLELLQARVDAATRHVDAEIAKEGTDIDEDERARRIYWRLRDEG